MRILVINGHPDPSPDHLCAALAGAYAEGARAGGHQVERLDVGALEFSMVRSLHDFQNGPVSADIDDARRQVRHADHLVFVFPLWFGSMPGLLKGFFEQLLRFGFTLSAPQSAMNSMLTGKSARLIVTMGAPTSVYRFILGGHGLSGLTRGLFWMTGVTPVRQTLFGRAHLDQPDRKAAWLTQVRDLGRRGG